MAADDGVIRTNADAQAAESQTLLGLPLITQKLAMPIVELVEDGHRTWRLHAPSRAVLALPPDTSGISLWYGLARPSYTNGGNTNGASFKIVLVGPDGGSRVLLDRILLPKTRIADQGMQAGEFRFDPVTGAQIVLETGTNGFSDWDWTVWSEVEVVLYPPQT